MDSSPTSSVGILLSNLGSPKSPSPQDVKTYLHQFLNDPYVINLPWIFRKILVNGIILNTRPKKSAEAYAKIWRKDGSPLVIYTKSLGKKLERAMKIPVEVGMRYGEPSISSAVEKLVNRGVKKIVFFPLYPQYSYAASETAIVEFERVMKKFSGVSFSLIEDFYNHPAFIQALKETIGAEYESMKPDLLLLSYHGIPKNQVFITRNKKNYHAHSLLTSRDLRNAMGLPIEKVRSTFQSRLGPTPWIRPFTDHVLVELPKQGVKRLLVASPSFTADCLETLEEIDLRYREQFLEAGGTEFKYVPCLNDSDRFVDAIQKMLASQI